MRYLATILLLLCAIALCTIAPACNSNGAATDEPNEVPPRELEPQAEKKQDKQGLTKEQRMSDAAMIVGLLERGYAPRDWKEESLGISFSKNSEDFLSLISGDVSDTEFYEALAKYIAGLHDSHTAVNFPSTYVSSLPFGVELIEGKVFVTEPCDEEDCNIQKGDELVAIDGKDAAKIQGELRQFMGHGNPLTEANFAARFLTYRPQDIFPTVPEGDASVTVRSRADGNVRDLNLKWKTEGYPMTSIGVSRTTQSKAATVSSGETYLLEMSRDRTSPHVGILNRFGRNKQNPFIPLDENFTERKKGPYLSGVMTSGNKQVAFIRFHTYSKRLINFDEAISELEEEIGFFDKNTDALIIDQTGNGGGDLCYLLRIASFFLESPQKEILDQWRANREILLELERRSLDEKAGANDRALAASIAIGIRNAMKGGLLLTEAYPVCSLDGIIKPYTTKDKKVITYTKPVLILIDEWAMSGGDYFPAIMKDLGRATLFGQTTAGAGGAVKRFDGLIGYSEIELSYTICLGVRAVEVPFGEEGNKTYYIENVGVSPDIEYKITLDDFLGGYRSYREAVEKAALGLIQ